MKILNTEIIDIVWMKLYRNILNDTYLNVSDDLYEDVNVMREIISNEIHNDLRITIENQLYDEKIR